MKIRKKGEVLNSFQYFALKIYVKFIEKFYQKYCKQKGKMIKWKGIIYGEKHKFIKFKIRLGV